MATLPPRAWAEQGPTGVRRSTGNTISANDAHGNPDDDLADLNDACDSNTWTGNTFKTATQTCIH